MKIDKNFFPNNISGKAMKIGVVVSTWNSQITNNLYLSTKETLESHDVESNNIYKIEVPGTFELVYGAKKINEKLKLDAIIVLGSVIKGETPHFNFICNSVANGIKDLNIKLNIPVIFGVLTDLNLNQAIERSSGEKNKGIECAIAAIQMAKL